MQHRLLLVFAFILCVLSCSAQLWNGLERPDARWFMGTDPTQVEQFGISYLDFKEEVTVGKVDSLSDFELGWANQSFLYKGQLLISNACSLLDSFEIELVRFDEGKTRQYYREYCVGSTFGFGHQGFLPLNDSIVLLDKEDYSMGDRPEWRDYTTSRSIYPLIIDGGTVRVGDHIEIETGDTILNQMMDYTSDGFGGWWGISKSVTSNRFLVFHHSIDSSFLFNVQRLGPAGFINERFTTRMRFNPEGSEFVVTGGDDGVAFYYFDRQTGHISLREVILNPDPEFEPYRVTCDVNWSADGRFVYLTDRHNIYQIDAFSSDLEASAIRISDDNPETDNIPYYRITRGPDCRMYVAIPGAAIPISVIDKPSLKGSACDLKPAGINMPSFYFVGIPEFPNYALWAKDRIALGLAPIIDTAVCDSSILAYPYIIWSSTAEVPEAEWSVYPNPVQGGGCVHISFPIGSVKQEEIFATLYNAAGQAVADLELQGGLDVQDLQVPVLPKGTYTLALGRRGESLGVQQVVVW